MDTPHNLGNSRRRLEWIAEAGGRPEVAKAIDLDFGCDLTVPIGSPLGPAEIKRLEAEHGVELPEDHRRFLAEVANGGLGPFGGMMSLEQGLSDLTWGLPLCDYGCAMTAVLLLDGPCRGEVWMHDPNSEDEGIEPWYHYKMLNGPIDEIHIEPDPALERAYRVLDWFDEWAIGVESAIGAA